ncbi:helix-turn-helix domain-containing protein [Natrinema halophilum]|uniref:Helix-turn-helix domain-containing protein n=1 Tax=Natrinema halophilum TaxID=1699371 RepID=A0A7D5GLT6_9EURY|nr:helix-turn-helix domain-containing protein [Natrinema halophilum]QLG50190.1 helix-turn-helix domain-containing protein [Natrinema halophilum]
MLSVIGDGLDGTGSTTMSLVVEYQINGPPITLPQAAAVVPESTLEIQNWHLDGGEIIWYVWATGDDASRITAAFTDVPNVVDVGVINELDDRGLFWVVMDLTLDEPPDDLCKQGTIIDARIRPDCLQFTSRVSGREYLRDVWEYFRSNDIDVTVLRLRQATETNEPRDQLTDAQFEALSTAYEMGYFDESERVTQADIAEELGISCSSVSARLRRAQHRLLEEQLFQSLG